jgi:hypothetical protein
MTVRVTYSRMYNTYLPVSWTGSTQQTLYSQAVLAENFMR